LESKGQGHITAIDAAIEFSFLVDILILTDSLLSIASCAKTGTDVWHPSICPLRSGIVSKSNKHHDTNRDPVSCCKDQVHCEIQNALNVSVSVFTSLVVSLIMPRLHYSNATLADLPEYQHRRLHSVLNAAARLIYQKSRCQHVTPLLRELHWLRSRERVDFKLAVFIFRCLHGLAPRYLSDDIRRVADSNRRRLRSSSLALLTV